MKRPGFLVYLYLLSVCVPAAAAPAHPMRDDPQAERLFQQEAKALQSLTTIQTEVTQTFYTRLASGKTNAWTITIPVRLMRPNYERVDLWDSGKLSDTEASDGTTKWQYETDDYDTTKLSPGPSGQRLGMTSRTLWGFFRPANRLKPRLARQKQNGTFLSLHFVGKATWKGQVYQVVDWTYVSPYQDANTRKLPGERDVITDRLYFGVDGLLHRVIEHSLMGYTVDTQMPNPILNLKMTAASFAYTPPSLPLSVRFKRFIASLREHF